MAGVETPHLAQCLALTQDMRVHDRLRTRRIALLDRIEQFSMLAQRILEPAGKTDGQPPGEFQYPPQVLKDLLLPAVARDVLHRLVHFGVGIRVALERSRGRGLFELFLQKTQPFEVLFVTGARHFRRAWRSGAPAQCPVHRHR